MHIIQGQTAEVAQNAKPRGKRVYPFEAQLGNTVIGRCPLLQLPGLKALCRHAQGW